MQSDLFYPEFDNFEMVWDRMSVSINHQ